MEESIIYVIIAVVWLVISLIRASNKQAKKKANPVAPAKPAQNQDIGKVLEELLGIKVQEPQPAPDTVSRQVTPQPKKKPKQTNPSYATFDKSSYQFQDDFVSDVRTKIQKKDENEPFLRQKPSYIDDFDLRKAVIWSEILNRKY